MKGVRVAGHNNLRGWNLFGVILYTTICIHVKVENDKKSNDENTGIYRTDFALFTIG